MNRNMINAIHYKTGKPVSVEIKDGYIVAVSDSDKETDLIIAPGLIDLQVNGYNGIDLNGAGLTANDVELMSYNICKDGVTSYFPTIITGSNDKIESLLRVIDATCKNISFVNDCVTGIHLEGPFISAEDGPRGAHPKEFVKAPDWDLFCRWQEAAGGRIRIITLSPEWSGSVEFIKRCAAAGVIVSIGHTAANPEQIRQAIDAGASMSTHLGNGSHLMMPRHDNYIWEQLASDSLCASIVADGFHLPDTLLKVFLRAKQDKSILVSDATYFTGFAPGEYESPIGGRVRLDAYGRLSMAQNPELLAGSAKSLLWCVNYLVNKKLLSLSEAWDMASLRPMGLLSGKTKNGLQAGDRADLVLFELIDNQIRIKQSIKAGNIAVCSLPGMAGG